MKTYQIRLYNTLLSLMILLGSLWLIYFSKVLMVVKENNIPALYPLIGLLLLIFPSIILSEYVISIEVN